MKMNILLLSCLLLAARSSSAADAAKPARAERKAAKQELPGAAAGLGGFEQVLTDEQRQKLREHMQANGEKLRASQREMIEARRELLEAVVNGKADEAFIKEKSEAIAKSEAEALRSRMNALAKVVTTLTPEQKEKIRSMGERRRNTRPGPNGGRRIGGAPANPQPAAPPPPEK